VGLNHLDTRVVGSKPDQGINACSRLSVLSCPMQVQAYATGLSLDQMSSTKCLNNIKKPPVCKAAKVLSRTVEPRRRRSKVTKFLGWT
jgi:hypothetical protein